MALTGNACGLSLAELAALSPWERSRVRARAEAELRDGGADLVIDSVASLPAALDFLETRGPA